MSDTMTELQDARKKIENDCISRRMAIEELMEAVPSYGLMDDDGNIESGCKDKDVIEMLEGLPNISGELYGCSEGLMESAYKYGMAKAQQYKEVDLVEVANAFSMTSLNPAIFWIGRLTELKQMGYVICQKM